MLLLLLLMLLLLLLLLLLHWRGCQFLLWRRLLRGRSRLVGG